MRREQAAPPSFRARRWSVMGIMWLFAAALVWRVVDRQLFETDFLQKEGQRRHLRVVEISAHRGMMLDRRGEPLAISTPVDSVWANPRALTANREQLTKLARLLDRDPAELRKYLQQRRHRAFTYLLRRITPDHAQRIQQFVDAEEINGIGLKREFRRYYPGGEAFAHVVGFTDVDDQGQDGMELAFNDWLQGIPGSKRVIRDGHARSVKDVESIKAPQAGKDLYLSLDWRLQYLAYRELKAEILHYRARSGSIVLLDATTGEILAMVNQPSYNPNDVSKRHGAQLRNRAMTDMFEPGSTMKPFTVASALELGRATPTTKIDTTPGRLQIGEAVVKDHHNLGLIDVATVIKKSSNVGISKIALDIPIKELLQLYTSLGFGVSTGSGFPGEVDGRLDATRRWSKIGQATLGFGYGLSVTPLQLAQAYAVIAADGVRRPPSLLRQEDKVVGERVMSRQTARQLRTMLESVVSPEGTANSAAIKGYRVAGKTGTVKKSTKGGYTEDQFRAVFAGMAPASSPRLVMVVVIDEPKGRRYYGGQVAAPLFSRVMTGVLRILNIAPDDMGDDMRIAASGGAER